MTSIYQIAEWLEQLAPLTLAESWDNVGLLLGDGRQEVSRLMTCLTVTDSTVDEAIDRRAELVVTHHPLPFHPVHKITTESIPGRLLWRLAAHRIAVYSLHTAYDSARQGLNQLWAERLELTHIQPLLLPTPGSGDGREVIEGPGRWGRLKTAVSVESFLETVKTVFGCTLCKVASDGRPVQVVAIACGSGGQLLDGAFQQGCDVLVTGETSFHSCLEAQARGMALVLVGHYASERRGVEHLASQLKQQFPQLDVWASQRETNPLCWM